MHDEHMARTEFLYVLYIMKDMIIDDNRRTRVIIRKACSVGLDVLTV